MDGAIESNQEKENPQWLIRGNLAKRDCYTEVPEISRLMVVFDVNVIVINGIVINSRQRRWQEGEKEVERQGDSGRADVGI